jgi:plastocyanin
VRRTVSSILLVVALAGLVSACGGDDDTTDTGLGSSSDSATTHGGGHDGMDDDMMSDGHVDDGSGEHPANTPVVPGARRVTLSGSSFEFDPLAITVQAGEDVAIVLTSADIEHDFTVDGLEAHVSAAAGETAEGGLRADEPGTYAYYCTVDGHRDAGMEGTLTVEPT